MKYLFILLVCSACSGSPMLREVQKRNPQCDVLKQKDLGSKTEFTLQCPGNKLKTVTLRKI